MQRIDSSAAFEFEVPKRIWPQYDGNFKFAAHVIVAFSTTKI
jgi:hypothetical protein